MPLLGIANFLRTTLSAPITSAATAAPLTSTARFPTTGYVCIWPASQGLVPPVGDPDSLGVEIASYGGVSGGQLTGMARGLGGTAAKNHNTPGETYYVAIAWVSPYRDEIEARLLETDGTHLYAPSGRLGVGRVPTYALDLSDATARIRVRDTDAGAAAPSLELVTSVDGRLVILESLQASAVARLTAGNSIALELGAHSTNGRLTIATSGDVSIAQALAVAGDLTAAGGFRQLVPGFSRSAGANDAAQRLDFTGVALARFVAVRAGSIVGLSAMAQNGWSAGSATFTVYLNGSPTALSTIINSAVNRVAATAAKDSIAFAAGDEISVWYQTASLAPVPNTLSAAIEIEE